MAINLYSHQVDALRKMKCGCILNGGVGSGKSITSLAYYHLYSGGKLEPFTDRINPRPLYIITTARKRDTLEWEKEMIPFFLFTSEKYGPCDTKVVVDSWNNIKKYQDVEDAFFIFDEDRVTGTGAWVRAFLKICKPCNNNHWIILSATPGDTWADYIPVFVANGFYKNITQFRNEHIEYDPYCKNFPKIKSYHNTKRLERLRDNILVDMTFERHTVRHEVDILCEYDKSQYNFVTKQRFNPFTNEPVVNAAELCHCWRRIVNTHSSRLFELCKLVNEKKQVIIFYNFDYELELIKSHLEGMNIDDEVLEIAEWNGHYHQEIPRSGFWAYLVQYTAGAEGWNCITTDTIIFYSQNYSYKVLEQSMGRIDRLNTPFTDLYYYHLRSYAPIDIMITRALKQKKKFNESRYVKSMELGVPDSLRAA